MSKYSIVHSVKVATDFTPETFGRLTTIGPRFLLPIGTQNRHPPYQVCRCECGQMVLVAVTHLKNEHTQSCGCLHVEATTRLLTTHGKARSREHITWKRIQQRCENPNTPQYPDYGGRGIRVCGRWREPKNGFLNFLADIGPRPSSKHSIDRIDVNGHYEPGNCRWATASEQARNKRNNRVLTYGGRTQCMMDWAEELGVSYRRLAYRISLGWTAEQAFADLVTPSLDCANILLPPPGSASADRVSGLQRL